MKKVLVCTGTGCVSSGSPKIADIIRGKLKEKNQDLRVVETGCHGFCEQGPIVIIEPEGRFYTKVTADDVEEIVDQEIVNHQPVERLLYHDPNTGDQALTYNDIKFYNLQQRIVLKKCGQIDPDNVQDYLDFGGYEALKKILTTMTPEEVIAEVKKSGLRGRGGGGFLTGLKWQFTRDAKGDKKYVICNADEGDPGAFMDRSLLEGDPHAVIEGMAICGYAVGADEGVVYVRAEYPLAIKRLETALKAAADGGFLGKNIFGSGFDFKIRIKKGAGAFVCGEETALIASVEGERGMPRVRPPFPAVKGLWGKPTNINNVETFGNVPEIFRMGADNYAAIGTEKSKGTKVFALTGKVNNTGLVEVPMGITMREIIFDIGGGIIGGKAFKAVQIGGPSGGCLPAELLDSPVDYDSLIAAGAMMGSGGLVVMDETTCMVDVAKYFLEFTQRESCGKCIPCREGTMRMLEILHRITEGHGKEEDIATLERLGQTCKSAALCGLGTTAPNPILATLRYFRDEYMAHIHEKKCPAGVCAALLTYTVNPDTCRGCGLCIKVCPVTAIAGERKQVHTINVDVCIKCGACVEKCPFGSIARA